MERYEWVKGNSWVVIEPAGTVKLGVLPQAIREWPMVTTVRIDVREGSPVKQGDRIGILVYRKTVVSIATPLSGVVVEVNKKLIENPSIVKVDPLGEGWLLRIQPTKLAEELGTLRK